MEKKSKVNGVTANGTWDSKYGTMYKFEVSFENGTWASTTQRPKTKTNLFKDKKPIILLPHVSTTAKRFTQTNP